MPSPEHKGLPVHGYRSQSEERVDLVNGLKVAEEQTLRMLETLALRLDVDHRCLNLAKTSTQQGFMWAVRAVFQPERIKLPDDV